ncbi:hypothetical protein BGX26_006882 [Mortierella sp. AD094]|nr:hypothetical protein BGX26_006882 [Mortierella sp. AD094]
MVSNGTAVNDVPKGFTFDLKNNKPAILIRPGSHSPDSTIRVYDSNKKFVGFISSAQGPGFQRLGRVTNVDATSGKFNFYEFDWDGTVFASENATLTPTAVAAGTYDIVVASQQKLTKGNYPADFEIFDLGSVTIA